MFARLRENFVYKMLALLCACALHYYVKSQQNPAMTRTLTIPLSARNLPANMLFDAKTAPVISVTAEGPADDINHLTETSLTAETDLSDAHLGTNRDLRVHVMTPQTMHGEVSLSVQPQTVSVVLRPKAKRRMEITAIYSGSPPLGYVYRTPTLLPPGATVSGSQDAVDAVRKLVVKADMENVSGPVDDDDQITALDAEDNPVPDVTITPSIVHVRVGIVREPAKKGLLVSPNIVNAPPFPYKIAEIIPKPNSVIVAGRPEVLGQIGTISTAPIDVAGATSDITREVPCIAPNGTTLVDTSPVTVTIHIVTEQPMVAPTPAAPNPATPGPTPAH